MVSKSVESVPLLTEKGNVFCDYGATATLKNQRSTYAIASIDPSVEFTPKCDDRQTHLTYPRAVLFVLCSKFFESFAANGVRTVLALYLRDSLSFSESSSTSFYHIFNFFSQFCPIFGAVLADSYFGNARTIYYLFFVYAIGWAGMIALTFPLNSLPVAPLVMSSLILISIGNGSIRACITSLGGSQFRLPQQSQQLGQYFSHYYFVYTVGILLSKVCPPSIRANTKCFGHEECYAAVFGALGAIFVLAWIVFLLGMFFYEDEKLEDRSEGNILFQVIGCVWHDAVKRFRPSTIDASGGNSWRNGSAQKYSEQFVQDVNAFLRVLKLFIPLPIYWSLYAQIDSSWTFQATELNTTVFNFRFEADQAKAMGAIMLLAMIPFWQKVLIPLLAAANVTIDPLKSVAVGGVCASLSFVCAGILQIVIEKSKLLEASAAAPTVSILWQIPQFFLIMLGEVMLSIPGLQFSFTQAPPSMKSVLTAAWFCNNAFGNLIVVAITAVRPFAARSNEYFLYASLMLFAICVFCWIARNYRYTNYDVDAETLIEPEL